MPRQTLDSEARPHTTPAQADQIATAARSRRLQMLPGAGPDTPERDEAVDHFRGADEIILGPEPVDGSYTADQRDDESSGEDE
jgi:hypothetical protein